MSSEEEEQGQMKSADSASAKSDDLKSEVSDPNFVLVSVRASCNFTVSVINFFFPSCLSQVSHVSSSSSSSRQTSLSSGQKDTDSR